MRKKRKVLNKQAYEKSQAIKGDVRQEVKVAALNAQARVHVDRKRAEKRGKIKHKGQANWPYSYLRVA